jgi:hypothetical protein
MELKDNPLLQPEDYMKGYNDKIDNLKNDPQLVSMDKLHYEVFVMNEHGKKLLEEWIDKYVIPPMADRNAPDFPIKAVWAEGFKDFIRMIRLGIISHKQRIKAGEKA